MALDKEKLRRLEPEERIRRLREIEDESKKEIEEAERLIRESEEDIRREEAVSEVEMPEAETVDITKLFGEEEEKLEETVREEAPLEETDEEKVMYEVEKIRDYMEHVGESPVSEYTMGKVERMSNELNSINYAQLSRQAADEFNATRNIVYEMKKHLGMR